MEFGKEGRRNDGFGGAWLGWIRPHRVGEEEEASAELCEVKPVSLRAWTVGVFKFGQRMDKVGSRPGTDDDVSCCIYGAGRGGRSSGHC